MPTTHPLSPLPHRYEPTLDRRPGRPPWPRAPRSASAKLTAPSFDGEKLRVLGEHELPEPFRIYYSDGKRWWSSVVADDAPIRAVALVGEYDQCIATPYDDEERVVCEPDFVEKLDSIAKSWAERLDAEVELDVDAKAFKAEVERVKAFYTTVGIVVRLEAHEAPAVRDVVALLSKLGLVRDTIIPTTFHLRDEDSGATEPILSASGIPVDESERVATFRFVVDLEVEDRAPLLRVELMIEAAEAVCRELGYAMQEEMTGASTPSEIRSVAGETIGMLEEDGMLDPFVERPRLLTNVKEADDEPYAVAERLTPEAAGRTLRFRHARWSKASLVWLLAGFAAGAALWGYVSLMPGVFASVFGVFLAQLARFELRARLDARSLELVVGKKTHNFALPIRPEKYGIWAMDKKTVWRDADGSELNPHPSQLPRALAHAIMVRSALSDVPNRDRRVLEAIDFEGLDWRGRREGYVGVAMTPDGHRVLGVFGDREAYESFASSDAKHVLAGVFLEDQSGKGASLGLPSPVEWYLSATDLPSREKVFGGEA